MGVIKSRVPAVALLLIAVARGQSCGSIAFSDSSSILTVSPILSFGGDFTIECWAKQTRINDLGPILFSLNDPTGPALLAVIFGAQGLASGIFPRGGFVFFSPNARQWYHYAISRAGSDLSIFVDGARVLQTPINGVIGSPTSVLRIGGRAFVDEETWPGAVANFRVVNGTALYT